jgi:hypothetical protein
MKRSRKGRKRRGQLRLRRRGLKKMHRRVKL